jgi:hypothetical protein
VLVMLVSLQMCAWPLAWLMSELMNERVGQYRHLEVFWWSCCLPSLRCADCLGDTAVYGGTVRHRPGDCTSCISVARTPAVALAKIMMTHHSGRTTSAQVRLRCQSFSYISQSQKTNDTLLGMAQQHPDAAVLESQHHCCALCPNHMPSA